MTIAQTMPHPFAAILQIQSPLLPSPSDSGMVDTAVECALKNKILPKTFGGSSVDTKMENISFDYEVIVNAEVNKQLLSPILTVFLPTIYVIVFIFGLPANCLALWMLTRHVRPKKPSTIYMINLAVADLLFVLLLPLKISYHFNGNNWTFGRLTCHLLVTSFYGNMFCSILLLTCISLDRYIAIVYPIKSLQWRRNRFAIAACMCIWIAILVSTTPLNLLNPIAHINNMGISTCYDVFPVELIPKYLFFYFIFMAVCGFFIPLLLTIYSEHTPVNLAVTVLLTFALCFIPSNVLLIVHYISSRVNDGNSGNLYTAYMVSLGLSSLNSCLDPFVYYFTSKECFKTHHSRAILTTTFIHVQTKIPTLPRSFTSHIHNNETCFGRFTFAFCSLASRRRSW
uniref:Coagulation factor II (thrombin) receptor-like 1, tandem duplicate 1 n=1 Tax=Eptatretus burgeri TaxID=7764 RepID=A0A8C4PXL4_EPTBU